MGIFVNELGFRPSDRKTATVNTEGRYALVNNFSAETVLVADVVSKGKDPASGDLCFIFDFSEICAEGEYYIYGPLKSLSDNESMDDRETADKVNSEISSEVFDLLISGAGSGDRFSAHFYISSNIYDDLLNKVLKCLYYQRCGCALEEKHAGIYTHACCHTDKALLLEDYLSGKKDVKLYDMTGGWHDAGDFGRYISPAGVTIGHLLYAYELFPAVFDKLELNIPETGNGVPDILNEARYELEWMLKMQAPDGGAYHKLTAWNHAEFIMPEDDHDRFIIYPVSSMATGDFAASMALASRVYRKFDSDFADKTLTAARKAFDWLKSHDYVAFHNPEGSGTGEYDDKSDKDERLWAAAELLRSDPEGDTQGYEAMLEKYVFSDIAKTDFGWTDVAGLGSMSVLTDPKRSGEDRIYQTLKAAILKEADRLIEIHDHSGYGVAMAPEDYVWGSNMVVANRGMLFALADMIAGGKSGSALNSEADKSNEKIADIYSSAVCAQLDYLLGRNALGRSYITGFGQHAIKHPHNRVTACDGIDDPMPGWVSGGPFARPCDEAAKKTIPAGTPPMKCHADEVGSYSTNEITIYWNSPVAFMLAFLKEKTS